MYEVNKHDPEGKCMNQLEAIPIEATFKTLSFPCKLPKFIEFEPFQEIGCLVLITRQRQPEIS